MIQWHAIQEALAALDRKAGVCTILSIVHALIYSILGCFLLTWLGNVICRLIFNPTGLRDATAIAEQPSHNAGRWIGTLERLILASGFILQRWEILAAVIPLKTVSRFQKLDKREFAQILPGWFVVQHFGDARRRRLAGL